MPLLKTEFIRIVLASQSPRRIELLKKIVTKFEVRPAHIDENLNGCTDSPAELVTELSYRKAESVASQVQEGIVIGADSVVVLNQHILGKPLNAEDSRKMLKLLSGKSHQVYTGFTVIALPKHVVVADYDLTRVKFRNLTDWEIDRYVESGQPLDKAGSYGIQDDGAVFVESIRGCYYNVMGLPVTKLFLVLKEMIANNFH